MKCFLWLWKCLALLFNFGDKQIYPCCDELSFMRLVKMTKKMTELDFVRWQNKRTVNLNCLSSTEINVYEDPRDTRSRDKFGLFTCFGIRIRSSYKVQFGHLFGVILRILSFMPNMILHFIFTTACSHFLCNNFSLCTKLLNLMNPILCHRDMC